jgi:hypothetical protein
MGGKGSGGARPGSGPKRRSQKADWLAGTAKKPKDAPVELPIVVAVPISVEGAARGVWDALAPHAIAAKTLTPATSLAFAMLCRVVVLETQLATTDPGGPDHRGVMQRMDSLMARFLLTGSGKASAPTEEKKDDFAEFDAPGTLQ